jgi:hypothetical protein
MAVCIQINDDTECITNIAAYHQMLKLYSSSYKKKKKKKIQINTCKKTTTKKKKEEEKKSVRSNLVFLQDFRYLAT